LTDTQINPNKAYYSRVKYTSDSSPAINSSYSGYNEFLTADSFAPVEWFTTNTAGGDLNWQGNVYGNGLWVAVSTSGSSTNDIMTSSDGITWASSTSTSLPSGKYTSIAYGDGYYVAVGRTTNIVKSTDGLSWNGSGNLVSPSGFESISFGNGTFAAVDSQGVKYITDITGNGWQSATIPAGSWGDSAFGNGKFVAVGADGKAMYSTNASTWTAGTIPGNQWTAVAYGNGRYVAVANTGSNRVAYSTDGITWTGTTSADESAQWSSITFGGLNFVAVSNDNSGGSAMYSTDGINWTAIPTIPLLQYETIAHGGGKFVALSRKDTINGSPVQCAYSYGS
jgi:hypothetical protein